MKFHKNKNVVWLSKADHRYFVIYVGQPELKKWAESHQPEMCGTIVLRDYCPHYASNVLTSYWLFGATKTKEKIKI